MDLSRKLGEEGGVHFQEDVRHVTCPVFVVLRIRLTRRNDRMVHKVECGVIFDALLYMDKTDRMSVPSYHFPLTSTINHRIKCAVS